MFFSGDASSRKKVDLGGRSSKERDRSKLLEQARIDREKRQRYRLETQSATRIQKCFRGRKAIAAERPAILSEFCALFGEYSEKADRDAFKPTSKYLSQLFFFFLVDNIDDYHRLVGVCQLLHQLTSESGDIVQLFTTGNYAHDRAIIEYRAQRLAFLCVKAVHYHRESVRMELLSPPQEPSLTTSSAALLLETVLMLTDAALPWADTVTDFLFDKNLFGLLRDILVSMLKERHEIIVTPSCIERALIFLALRHLQRVQSGRSIALKLSFGTQILSLPLLWKHFPQLKQVYVSERLWDLSIHQLASSIADLHHLLPSASSPRFPSHICLLGNILEASAMVFCSGKSSLQEALQFVLVARSLMEELPSSYFRSLEKTYVAFDENMYEDSGTSNLVPEESLENQLLHAVDFDFLKHLVRVTFPGSLDMSIIEAPSDAEAVLVTEVSGFLYSTLTVFPNTRVITGLAYSTQLVPRLWHYMKRCHLAGHWPNVQLQGMNNVESNLSDSIGWMLPLSLFCPVYSFMLMSIDSEEFYEQQKPLVLEDVKHLVFILKEALWQLLWVLPSKHTTGSMIITHKPGQKVCSQFLPFRQRVSKLSARLLAELQDWNNRRQFMPSQDFHAREAMDEVFFTQVEHENTRAHDVLYQAPFLIPFIHRVRIYTAQLSTARQQSNLHTPFSRLRVKIRRNRIVEDAFTNINSLSEDALRGVIQITFVNELGVEEAGIDGGGIFKDFMENITKAAFDIQYGLFKETSDRLLYPNPASHMVHDEHLLYFEFLGKILGKAMFEGILVDIPFATFFLSKLKKKHNYLHDLPSLDPELFRSLLFLKHYEGDISQLGLYFVIENNDYGEQVEVDLLPGGKDIPVTNTNVIRYIHLVANHRLNSQIRQQSYYFLRGFQQLIKPEWIDMFSEHELQVLISGSLEVMDVDDLRMNAHYSGGYSEEHHVIQMFWEVLKTLDFSLQQNFLKFVTGCSRGPLLGFKYLEPQFCIQRTAPEDSSDDVLDRLPTSATCMNLLKLPPYKRKEVLQEKLLYAINADAGFDLS